MKWLAALVMFFLVCNFSYFGTVAFLCYFSRQSSLGAPESGDYSAKIQLFDGKCDVFHFVFVCTILYEVLLLYVHEALFSAHVYY